MEHLVEAKKILSNYCSTFNDFCHKYIKLIEEMAILTARARVDDLTWKEDYSGIDSGIFEMIRKLVYMYSRYIAGFYLTSEDRVAVKILRNVSLEKISLDRGEVIFLPVQEAFALSLADLAVPIESNLIRLQRSFQKEEKDKGASEK